MPMYTMSVFSWKRECPFLSLLSAYNTILADQFIGWSGKSPTWPENSTCLEFWTKFWPKLELNLICKAFYCTCSVYYCLHLAYLIWDLLQCWIRHYQKVRGELSSRIAQHFISYRYFINLEIFKNGHFIIDIKNQNQKHVISVHWTVFNWNCCFWINLQERTFE